MGGLIDSRSIEAEIADCCRDLYRATAPEVAMVNWARLRDLKRQWTEAEMRQFARETRGRAPETEHLDDAEANALICFCD